MILTASFTLFHVLLSFIGVASDFVALYGLLTSKWSGVPNPMFLIATVATSITGFFFSLHHFLPSYRRLVPDIRHWHFHREPLRMT
jgi:hypothetical protein